MKRWGYSKKEGFEYPLIDQNVYVLEKSAINSTKHAKKESVHRLPTLELVFAQDYQSQFSYHSMTDQSGLLALLRKLSSVPTHRVCQYSRQNQWNENTLCLCVAFFIVFLLVFVYNGFVKMYGRRAIKSICQRGKTQECF